MSCGRSVQNIVLLCACLPSHSKYNDFTLDYDIALLRLAAPVDLSRYTPVCLPR